MKIAGRKNDGAWFRANKEIHAYETNVKEALMAAIAGSDFIQAFVTVMDGIATEVGADLQAFDSVGDYADVLVNRGIPRQVWNGKLSWTIYDKVVDGDETSYVPRGQSEAHFFGKDLRKIVTKFIFARRMTADIADFGGLGEGNPGGLPDANAET